MAQEKYQADVVIVGGGLAGIVSALELLEEGKKVLILDRGSEEEFGGLCKLAFGGMFFVDTPLQRIGGIKDSPELALKDWFAVAQFDETDKWPKAWAKLYVNTCTDLVYKWLQKNKINFFPVVHWVERGLERTGNSVPRFHMVWGTGFELSNRLSKLLLEHRAAKENLQIKFHHKVEEILVENGCVIGVSGNQETQDKFSLEIKQEKSFIAKGQNTVIATGGLGGSMEKVRKYWNKDFGTAPEIILNGTNTYADGHMHEAVKNINGKLTHLDNHWHYAAGIHHPKPHFVNQGLSLVPPKSALWLNYKGERIGPKPLITAFDTRFLVEQVCKQEKKMSWQVLNMKIAYKEFAISGSEHNEAIRDKKFFSFLQGILFGNKKLVNHMIADCEDFVIANSIEELAEKMNALNGNNDVDVNSMREAINNYDSQIDLGEDKFTDEQLKRIQEVRKYRGDKVRTCKYQKINDKSTFPLIAIREFVVSRKTLGGIQTDLDCRVLSDNLANEPIPGLFAIGESAGFGGGGMHGKAALEGTFLGGCVLTGRIVAKTIVGKKLI